MPNLPDEDIEKFQNSIRYDQKTPTDIDKDSGIDRQSRYNKYFLDMNKNSISSIRASVHAEIYLLELFFGRIVIIGMYYQSLYTMIVIVRGSTAESILVLLGPFMIYAKSAKQIRCVFQKVLMNQ